MEKNIADEIYPTHIKVVQRRKQRNSVILVNGMSGLSERVVGAVMLFSLDQRQKCTDVRNQKGDVENDENTEISKV